MPVSIPLRQAYQVLPHLLCGLAAIPCFLFIPDCCAFLSVQFSFAVGTKCNTNIATPKRSINSNPNNNKEKNEKNMLLGSPHHTCQ